MPLLLREIISILFLSAITFAVVRPIASRMIATEDFARRRNVWFALTVLAFVSPSFWLFTLFAAPILVIAGRRDPNPTALYLLLLQVIPPFSVAAPMIGMSRLVSVDIYLLLALLVMTPAALRIRRNRASSQYFGPKWMDYLLVSYGILTAFYYIHVESAVGAVYEATVISSLRRIVVYMVAICIPYYVISRSCNTRRLIVDALASFVTSCAIMSVIALFESARHWLLYADLGSNWGIDGKLTSYLLRGHDLRAMASSGHSLALGTMLAIGFGFWLFLQRYLDSRLQKLAGLVVLCLGLIAAYSRGPWVGAVCIYFVFAALSPRGAVRVVKAAFVALLGATALYFTPIGEKVASVLPIFGGKIDAIDIDYRQRLFNRTWEIVRESPLFGDQSAMLRMQDLRQGQGIIDFVNAYASVLLGSGFVGLFLFLSFIVIALQKALSCSRAIRTSDAELSSLGICLASCTIGMLVMLESGGFDTGPMYIFYVLAGLSASYASLVISQLNAPHNEEPSGPIRSGSLKVGRSDG
jgi:hypothetical protein